VSFGRKQMDLGEGMGMAVLMGEDPTGPPAASPAVP
jgi:hypothetical protein